MEELENKQTSNIEERIDKIEEVIDEKSAVSVVDEDLSGNSVIVDEAESVQDESESEINAEQEVTYKEMSPIRLIMRRFFRSRLSIVGLVMIIALICFCVFGPMIYQKWGETEIDQTPVESTIQNSYNVKNADGQTITVIEELQYVSSTNDYAAPSKDHLLGTDDKGMDVFVRLMYGGRISLMIGFIVVILETIIGVILGGLAGYFGGKVDQVIMRIVDIFNCIPTLPILLIASAVIDSWVVGGIVQGSSRIYILMVMITIFSWSGTARLVRGQILSLREQEYITATEVMGLPTWRKIFVHLIPNVMPQLIVSMTLGLGSVILYESTLSYLGLGVQMPNVAWGTMIALVNDPIIFKYHPNVWLPAGIMIVIAVLGFNFVGDGLRDAMDPKAKK